MAEVPASETEPERQTITEGYFEEEMVVDAQDLGDFLVELGKQFQATDEITLTGEDWELPFSFREPVELEIEFEGSGEGELEIEIELKGGSKDETPGLA